MIVGTRGLGCPDCYEEGLTGILGDLGLIDCTTLRPASDVPGTTQYEADNAAEGTCIVQEESAGQIPLAITSPSIISQIVSGTVATPPNVTVSSGVVDIGPPIAPLPALGPATATPSPSQVIQQSTVTTSGGVTPIPVIASDNPFMDWLGLSSTPSPSLIGGIPNWLIALGGIGALAFLSGGKE